MGFWQLLFSLNGRVSRRQFWTGKVLSFVMLGVLFGLIAFIEESGMLNRVFSEQTVTEYFPWTLLIALVAYEFSSIALELKRWHDLGRSFLAPLILHAFPIVGSLVAALMVGLLEGVHGPNQYGPDPINRPNEHDDLTRYGLDG